MKLSLAAAVAALALTACGSGPAVPHSVDSTSDETCLSCHRDGIGGATKTPHPDRTGCVDCHEASK